MSGVAWRQRLRALTFRVGRSRGPWLLALALLTAGVAINLFEVPREERLLLQARLASDAAQRDARASRPAAPTSTSAPTQDLDRWRAALPPPAARQPRVAALLALAGADGLVHKRVEFRYSSDPALGVARYRVTLPLTGRYSSIRLFIESALAADPALLLDSVRLTRSSGLASDVAAQFSFSLLMRSEASGEGLSATSRPARAAVVDIASSERP